MRQVVLDTETTGIGHAKGHRLIEIGCVELMHRKLTSRRFHTYLNPEREVDAGAFKVHGISTAFLADKPLFKDVFQELLAFIDGAEVIIHNASFDVGFLNAELERVKWKKRIEQHATIIDTLALAREKHPGLRNTLDALCKRYDVTHFNRALHGALLDAEILAFVYLAMTGGQTTLFAEEGIAEHHQKESVVTPLKSDSPVLMATPLELSAHDEFIQLIIKKSKIDLFSTLKSECAST